MEKHQTYNDGTVKIYATTNTAQPGDMPVDGIALKETLRYEERAVGIERYSLGLKDGIRVDKLLRVPKLQNVATQDVAIPIDGKQYEIKRVQYPPGVVPPSMDLTLERLVSEYDITGA